MRIACLDLKIADFTVADGNEVEARVKSIPLLLYYINNVFHANYYFVSIIFRKSLTSFCMSATGFQVINKIG